MTEAEWLASRDPRSMLALLGDRASPRKLRLFAVACCRRIEHLLEAREVREVIAVAERYADGVASPKERRAAESRIGRVYNWFDPHGLAGGSDPSYRELLQATAIEAVRRTVCSAPDPYSASNSAAAGQGFHAALSQAGQSAPDPNRGGLALLQARVDELGEHARLLRDVVGNPFRPVAVDPAWLTSTVVGLARGIYEDRAFDRLPVLADALQDTGCGDADLLAHCRDPRLTHVRGCWAVDLLLGKT